MDQLNPLYSFECPYCDFGQWIRNYYGVQPDEIGLPDRVRHHIQRTQSPVGTFIRQHWWALNCSSDTLFEPALSLEQTIVFGMAEPDDYEFDPRWPDADLLVLDQTNYEAQQTPMDEIISYAERPLSMVHMSFEEYLSHFDSNANLTLPVPQIPSLTHQYTQSELPTSTWFYDDPEPAPNFYFGPHEDPTDIFTWDFRPRDETQGPVATLEDSMPPTFTLREDWWNVPSGLNPHVETVLPVLAPAFDPQSSPVAPPFSPITPPQDSLPSPPPPPPPPPPSSPPPLEPPHIDPWYFWDPLPPSSQVREPCEISRRRGQDILESEKDDFSI